jgi:hypothetical protein
MNFSAPKALEDVTIDGPPRPIGSAHDQAPEEASELTVRGSPPLHPNSDRQSVLAALDACFYIGHDGVRRAIWPRRG